MKHIVFRAEMEGIVIERCTRDTVFNMGNKHWHPECEIQYILEGTRWVFIDDQTYKAAKGSLVLIDSEQVHRTMSDEKAYHDRILLLFEKNKMEGPCKAFGLDLEQFLRKNKGVLAIPSEERKGLERLLTDIAEEISQREEGYPAMSQMRIMELCLYIARLRQRGKSSEKEDGAKDSKSQSVYQVMSYIKAHYEEAGSLKDIADRFYLDKCYLSRIFKQATGFTVNEYINIQRIRKAQYLLEETSNGVTEIAEKVGYDNAAYFSRIFRKYIGSTPLQYRKKRKAYKQSMREKDGL